MSELTLKKAIKKLEKISFAGNLSKAGKSKCWLAASSVGRVMLHINAKRIFRQFQARQALNMMSTIQFRFIFGLMLAVFCMPGASPGANPGLTGHSMAYSTQNGPPVHS